MVADEVVDEVDEVAHGSNESWHMYVRRASLKASGFEVRASSSCSNTRADACRTRRTTAGCRTS